jgi:predicted RecB family nuclease
MSIDVRKVILTITEGALVTSQLFEAYLACPTKCFLKHAGAANKENTVALWQTERNERYRHDAMKTLSADFELFLDQSVQSDNLKATIHAIQVVRSDKRRGESKIVPLHFVPSNKVTRSDRLLAVFNALVLSKSRGVRIDFTTIVYGDAKSKTSVKTNGLLRDVTKAIQNVVNLLSDSSPPDLILNSHCPACEYRDRCKRIATEKNDLSLLGALTEKERAQLHKKGIFTVHQLSYTFRPRRRAKRLGSRPEKYHQSLKALAIRKGETHVVGDVQLRIDGTPVIFDVEGIPDRDFFYLIGVRFDSIQNTAFQYLWADDIADEGTIWKEFLDVLANIESPVLLHYGSYEKAFLEKMGRRYGSPGEESPVGRAIRQPINILSLIYAQVYFPTYSNGLKEIAAFLGFQWSDPLSSGLQSIVWRHQWEQSHDSVVREKLIAYNADDCSALSLLVHALRLLERSFQDADATSESKVSVTRVETLAKSVGSKWSRFESPLPELVQINSAAHWNYQRDRVFVRSGVTKRRKRSIPTRAKRRAVPKINLPIGAPESCPECGGKWRKARIVVSRPVQDLLFGTDSVKRRLVNYFFQPHRCLTCKKAFAMHNWYQRGRLRKWGWNVRAYFIYHAVGLRVPQLTIEHHLHNLFGFELRRSTLNNLKITAADFYSITAARVLHRIIRGKIIHIDETTANIKGHLAYVWVMTNLREVAYVLSQSREGDFARELLKDFRGVLVSDFYAAYDGINCKQQKCLIHLMRDLNDHMLNNPFDREVKSIVVSFAGLLKAMVETIDRRGLKRYFLRKHRKQVDQFFEFLDRSNFKSEAAVKVQQRFAKSRDKLFTFLDHDGVSWNNNNAEHAIKAFARLRKVISGTSTKKGVEEYLTLLTVAQTCEYSGIDFLDFLRSGERDIEAFAARKANALRARV